MNAAQLLHRARLVAPTTINECSPTEWAREHRQSALDVVEKLVKCECGTLRRVYAVPHGTTWSKDGERHVLRDCMGREVSP